MSTQSIAHLIEASQDETLKVIWLYDNYPGHCISFVNGKRTNYDVSEEQYNEFLQYLDHAPFAITPSFNGCKAKPVEKMTFEQTMRAIEFWNAANPNDKHEVPF